MSNGLVTPALPPRRLRYDRVESAKARERLGWSLAVGTNGSGAQQDRRAEARVAAPGFVCRVAWRRWFATREQPVLIVNMSRGGALIFLDEPPPLGQRLWLALETPRQRVTVPARVLDVRRTRLGQAAVRIAFARKWPYDLFEAAVCGLPPIAPRSKPRAERRGPEAESPQERSDV